MATILDEIVDYKRDFVAQAKRDRPLEVVQAQLGEGPPTKDFAGVLCKPDTVAIIAEIKKASPSRGVIRPVGGYPHPAGRRGYDRPAQGVGSAARWQNDRHQP